MLDLGTQGPQNARFCLETADDLTTDGLDDDDEGLTRVCERAEASSEGGKREWAGERGMRSKTGRLS